MSSRQHAPLLVIETDQTSRHLPPIPLEATRGTGGYDEAWVRDLIFDHPAAIPVQEIDPSFGPLIGVCKELDTRGAGYADALYINSMGMPTLVECKLWRNPEARREVVGQIIDYARALRRWTFSDLQREAARARKEQGFDLAAHVRKAVGGELDTAAFVDNVTRNLTRSRIMLLVLGDGIREGVEAIADYVQNTTGMHFTFGLVEAQVFDLGDGRRIVQPRVLARTFVINRTVVELTRPEMSISDPVDESPVDRRRNPTPTETVEQTDYQSWMSAFWTEMLDGLKLDDAEQRMANPLSRGNITFYLVARSATWITCNFLQQKEQIGVFVGYDKTSAIARAIIQRLFEDRSTIADEIGFPVIWTQEPDGKIYASSIASFHPLFEPSHRQEQLEWFRARVNAFVNCFRPRVKEFLREITEGGLPT